MARGELAVASGEMQVKDVDIKNKEWSLFAARDEKAFLEEELLKAREARDEAVRSIGPMHQELERYKHELFECNEQLCEAQDYGKSCDQRIKQMQMQYEAAEAELIAARDAHQDRAQQVR